MGGDAVIEFFSFLSLSFFFFFFENCHNFHSFFKDKESWYNASKADGGESWSGDKVLNQEPFTLLLC